MENKQTEKIIYIENKNITAIQWLIRQQKHNKYFDDETIEQAKKMERNQIEKSYSDGFDDGYLLANGEDTKFDDCYLYYHETYGK